MSDPTTKSESFNPFLKMAALAHGLSSPDGQPVALNRRRVDLSQEDGGKAVLKTVSQYTKILRHMCAENLISQDQLLYLQDVIKDKKSDFARITKRCILDYSTATEEDLKGRYLSQLLEGTPNFDQHRASYFPFPVQHLSWVIQTHGGHWEPVGCHDILVLEHSSWLMSDDTSDETRAIIRESLMASSDCDLTGEVQGSSNNLGVLIDSGKVGIDLMKRQATYRYRKVPRRAVTRMTWYFEYNDPSDGTKSVRHPFLEHLACKVEKVYSAEILLKKATKQRLNGRFPFPFRDFMWEAGGHKNFGGPRSRPLRIEDHYTAFVSIFGTLFDDPNFKRLRKHVTCICRGLPRRRDFPFGSVSLLAQACREVVQSHSSGAGVGAVVDVSIEQNLLDDVLAASKNIHRRPQCKDVVFLVHGIGQAIKTKAAPSVHKHADTMRRTWTQHLNKQFHRAQEAAIKGGAKLSSMFLQEKLVEVIPVEWASKILGEYSGLQNAIIKDAITPEGVPVVREMLNERVYDALLYLDSNNGDLLLDQLVEQLNENYRAFRQAFPEFTGNISIVAHSLGSVITNDLLVKRGSQLSFPVKSTILLGSILPLVLASRHQAFGKTWKYPNSMRLYSVSHPYDAISYRFEPLVDTELASCAPVQLPGTLASNVLNHKAFETLIKHHVRHRNGDEKEFGEINNGCRVDFQMKASSPKAFQYFALMTAHVSYFKKPEVLNFILSALLFGHQK